MRMCRSCCGCTCTLTGILPYGGCAVPTTIPLSGIGSPGGGTISVTATSSDTTLIPFIGVTYTSPNATGSLQLNWGRGTGTAVVSVTVSSTACSPVTRTFTVTPNTTTGPPRINAIGPISFPWATGGTVSLSGINIGLNPVGAATTLSITASSTNPGVMPNGFVTYTYPNTTGTIALSAFGPGTVTFVVAVTTNGPSGGCNNNQATTTFTATAT
jgi:hypothetical protein